jgi:hypothetical protein
LDDADLKSPAIVTTKSGQEKKTAQRGATLSGTTQAHGFMHQDDEGCQLERYVTLN